MWDFIGNELAVAALDRALRDGRSTHAYLFVGPEQVGKVTLALKLAQALNCEGADQPCGACQPCRRIAAGIHADVQLVRIEPSEEEGPQHKAISVGQIREVERTVALTPFEGRTRVVIIDPAHAMNAEAQNAFLKTLEEPSPHVVFVLIAVQEERLLPTVRSRCQRIGFRLLPRASIEQALGGDTEPELAQLLARLARGRIGWALQAARDASVMERRRQALVSARAPATMTVAQRFDLAESLAANFRRGREEALDLLRQWQGWWRDVLLVQATVENGVVNTDMLTELREDAARCSREEVLAFLRALLSSQQHLMGNVQPRLALEALLLTAPGSAITPGLS